MRRLRRVVRMLALSTLAALAGIVPAVPVFALSSGTTGSWSISSNNLPTTQYAHGAVTYGGYAYTFGGLSVSGPINSVYSAKLNSDGTTGSWSSLSNTLPQNLWGVTASEYNGYVYVLGGDDSISVKDTVYYAKLGSGGTIGSWTAGTALPAARYLGSSVVYNGHLYYLAGGNDSSAYSASVYHALLNADGSVGSWQAASNSLPTAAYFGSAVVNRGYIYFIGGSATSGYLDDVSIAKINADGSVGAWTASAHKLPVTTTAGSVAAYNGYLFFFGGNANAILSSSVYSTHLNPDGSIDAWSSLSENLPAGEQEAVALVYNGYAFLVGGNTTAGNNKVFSAQLMGGVAPTLKSNVIINVASGVSSTFDVVSGVAGLPSDNTVFQVVATVSLITLAAGLLLNRANRRTQPDGV